MEKIRGEKDQLLRVQTSSFMLSVSNLTLKTDIHEPSTTSEHPCFTERGTSDTSQPER
jgi:hypothetical protein